MAASQRYLALLDEMIELHKAKAAGYSGDNPDTWVNFRGAEDWGISAFDGCMVRMTDKVKRAQNLRKNPDNDKVGESMRDTLMDLAAYALIGICLLEEQDGDKYLCVHCLEYFPQNSVHTHT